MDAALRRMLDELVDYLFADAEPTPEELEVRREAFPPERLNLAGLFLNLRLMVRWREFGVGHLNIKVRGEEVPGVVTLGVRVFDPLDSQEVIEHGLRRAGFINISYQDELGGMGGWIDATAPRELVQRLQGV